MREVPILIKIISGETCGMSLIGMDVPDDMKLNETMKEIVKQDLISVEVEEVELIKSKTEKIASFHCSIDKVNKAKLVLNYNISKDDHMYLYDFYYKNPNQKLAKDNNKAIMLIKNIIDSYDPMIQVISE